jgi:2-hydroxychromene-2-carboxylate isomerase
MPTLQFWFEIGSTYSYLTVARIGRTAEAAGVDVEWRPFLLAPILQKAGMAQGPFLPYPIKTAYMWRDIERRAQEHGVPYLQPLKYPPDEVLGTARLALLGMHEGWGRVFVEQVFRLHWTRRIQIGTPENIAGALTAAGQEPQAAIERSRAPGLKEALRAQTELAESKGIFGSPTFIVGDELFWGDDRLEQAIAWAKGSN